MPSVCRPYSLVASVNTVKTEVHTLCECILVVESCAVQKLFIRVTPRVIYWIQICVGDFLAFYEV